MLGPIAIWPVKLDIKPL